MDAAQRQPGGYVEIEVTEPNKPDPRIATAVRCALGTADSVVNVGAGAGSYEPPDRYVVAVEPSMKMIAQRSARSASVVQATAMSLPFQPDSFDAALAVLTVHYWPDKALGLSELRRVARRHVVVLTWDRAAAHNFHRIVTVAPGRRSGRGVHLARVPSDGRSISGTA